MKTFLKILAGVLVGGLLAGAGYLAYKYFIAPDATAPLAPVAGQPVETAITADGAVKPVSGNPVEDFWVNSKTGDVYFLKTGGVLAKASPDQRDKEIGGQVINDFNRFIPSPDGSRVIAVVDYPQNPIFAVYDALNNTWERLPAGTLAADFDPSSSKIAYLKAKVGSISGGLFTLDLVSKKTAEVMRLNLLNGELKWSAPNDVFIIADDVWYINLAQKTILNTAGAEAGIAYLFAENNYNALKLVQRGANGYALVLIHQIGGILNELSFLTLPSKCVFDKDRLYCAVPKSLPRATLPDDYLKEKFYTEDVFITYDTESGEEPKIMYAGEAPIDADSLAIKGNQLLFRNRYDGKIYSLSVKK